MIYEISYANELYSKALSLNAKTAKIFGKADIVISYEPKDIDHNFLDENRELLSAKKGNGYWIWKPYFIRKTLDKMEDGDYLYYCDAGSICIRSIRHLVNFMEKNVPYQDILCFNYPSKEYEYTKRDAMALMDIDKPEVANTNQIQAVYILVKKSNMSVKIIDEWLECCTDANLITGSEPLGLQHYNGFKEHRYDQSLWSLVCKKNNLKVFRDPCGSKIDSDEYCDSTYPAINISIRGNNNNIYYKLFRNIIRFCAVSILKKIPGLYKFLKENR